MTTPPARADEDALIARFFAPMAGPGAEGLRDDAASLTPRPGHDLVLTTDAIVEGVHYLQGDPPESIARKALGVNLSDLAAKGTEPRGFLLTLALADDWTEEWLAGFADGLRAASAEYGCVLLGGDTVRAAGPTLVSITAIGEVPCGTIIRRQSARPGDRLCVSGTIGDAALGLIQCREPDLRIAAEDRAYLIERYRHPRPRLALAPVLRAHARAAMDISDGLVGDLAKMLSEGMSARVTIPDIPLSQAARQALAADPARLETILTGGDDYEILCAVAPESLGAFLEEAQGAGLPVSVIGTVLEGEGAPVFVAENGNERRFTKGGFRHF